VLENCIFTFGRYEFSHGLDPNRTSAVKLTTSIERQWRPIFLVAHADEVISRVNVSCSAEEKLFERAGSASASRINNPTKANGIPRGPFFDPPLGG
jgi:hypothetical protein